MTRGKKNKKASQSYSYGLLPHEYIEARSRNLPKTRLQTILVAYNDSYCRLINGSSDSACIQYLNMIRAISDEYLRISKNNI